MEADVRDQANPASETAGQARHNGDGRHGPHLPPKEAVQRLLGMVGEYKEYLAYLVGTKIDSTKASIRNAGLYAALGVVGLVALISLISTAVGLTLVGLAWGLGLLFGGRFWLGTLLVGLVVLIGIGLGAYVMVGKLRNSFRNSTVEKYEQRKGWQRKQYGRDVEAQAAAAEKPR